MNKNYFTLFYIFIFVFCSACPFSLSDKDKKQIIEINRAYQKAENAKHAIEWARKRFADLSEEMFLENNWSLNKEDIDLLKEAYKNISEAEIEYKKAQEEFEKIRDQN